MKKVHLGIAIGTLSLLGTVLAPSLNLRFTYHHRYRRADFLLLLGTRHPQVSYSVFMKQVAAGQVERTIALQEFVAKHQPRFSRKAIEQFAQSHKRHPGIILERLHNDGFVPHKNLRALLVKISLFLG